MLILLYLDSSDLLLNFENLCKTCKKQNYCHNYNHFHFFILVLLVLLSSFNFCSFLSSISFSLLNDPSFLSSSFKFLLKILPNGEYSNLACSIVFGFKPKSSSVKYSILSRFLEDRADIIAAFLSKSYCASFCRIFLSKL